MRTLPVLLVVGAAAQFAMACSDAPGTAQGGLYLFDAGAPMSTSSSSGTMINPNLPMACTSGGTNSGNKWSDLYACYFGPTGTDSCAGSPGGCHGDANSSGGGTWVCGATQASCRLGLISKMITSGTGDFTDALLYSQVCKIDGTGLMPLGCDTAVQLYPTDMARIQTWLQAGTPDN